MIVLTAVQTVVLQDARLHVVANVPQDAKEAVLQVVQQVVNIGVQESQDYK